MSVLRVGVMGCSSFARRAMIPALQECDSSELICVASRSEEKAEEVAQQFSCEAITGYDNLLKVGYTSLFYEAVGVATVRNRLHN